MFREMRITRTIRTITAVFMAVIMMTAACVSTSYAGTGYVGTTKAYTELNKFRTRKGVWHWKKGNKSKAYYNTNSRNKLCKLKKDPKLVKTAKIRAKGIAKKYSHTRPNGTDCFTAYPKRRYVGENIACGYDTAKEVTEEWQENGCKYAGQGHRRNMLDKKFKYVGIACYEKNGVKYWVQAFSN